MEDSMNYKNRKPKSYKGHCGMCALHDSNGKRNGRRLTIQEQRVKYDDAEYENTPNLREGFTDEQDNKS